MSVLHVAMVVLLTAAACTSGWSQSGPPPFSAAETDRALAPVKGLERRCYDGSASKREKRHVQLEFLLFVDEQGSVRSDPLHGEPRDPQLLECLRNGLDELRFPAKNVTDQLRVSFDLTP